MSYFQFLFRLAVCLIVVVGFHLSIHGQVISWTGLGDGVSWSDADNWDLPTIPGAANYVLISGFPSGVKVDVVVPRVQAIDVINSDLIVSDSLTVSSSDTVCIRLTNSNLSIGAAMLVTSGDEFAINVDANSQIMVGGELTMKLVGSVGIQNDGTIFVQQTGTVNLEDVATLALRNNAIFNVSGQMNMLRTTGVLNNGTFTVNPGGDLFFDNKTSDHTFPAFFNQGDLNNQGSIIIKNFAGEGILQQGLNNSITNTGKIIIDSTEEQCIYLNGGLFTNNGTISVGHSDEEGMYFIGGTFDNHDSLKIHHVARSGILMDFPFSTTSHLNNYAGGFIEILNSATSLSTTSGIKLGDPGSITNEGTMILDNCGNYGVKISDAAIFTMTDGLLTLKNMPQKGFFAQGTSSTIIGSNSELRIESTAQDLLQVDMNATWDISGLLTIQN